jgi:hypothetical protein
MASTSLVKLLATRWYITVSGVLLSLVLAAGAFCYFPVQYSSTATVVLVPPKLLSSNPMLEFNAGVSMTTLVLVQALSSPEVESKLGIPAPRSAIADPGADSYTVKNVGSIDLRDDGADRPFITITAQSLVPDRSEVIVAQVLDEARQQLKDRQLSMNVSRARSIQLDTVVGPVPAKVVLTMSLKAIGIALVLGFTATLIAVCVSDRMARRSRPATGTPAHPKSGLQPEPLPGLPAEPELVSIQSAERSVARELDIPAGSLPGGADVSSSNGRPLGFERAL